MAIYNQQSCYCPNCLHSSGVWVRLNLQRNWVAFSENMMPGVWDNANSLGCFEKCNNIRESYDFYYYLNGIRNIFEVDLPISNCWVINNWFCHYFSAFYKFDTPCHAYFVIPTAYILYPNLVVIYINEWFKKCLT